MKIAIDSYTFHRYFGEIYPGLETDPGSRLTSEALLQRCTELGVQGISLESCFFSDTSPAAMDSLRQHLDRRELERVWAWGHPGGLQSGAAPEQLDDLKAHVVVAQRLEAKVMRICCGGRRTRPENWAAHRLALLPLLEEAASYASRHGVVLAIENHIDLLADELVDLLETIGSPWLGVCLDTANNLRMLEDPMMAIEKLAPYARATHIKDIAAWRGSPREFAFWPSVPTGKGLINMPRTFGLLQKQGYSGLLALEIDYLHPAYPDDQQAITDSLAYMRSLL